MAAKRQIEAAWITLAGGKVHLDSEELGDVLGVPYDYTVNGSVLEISLFHVVAIVSGHMRVGDYMHGVTARLRALPHVLSAKAAVKRRTITVEFALPVEVD